MEDRGNFRDFDHRKENEIKRFYVYYRNLEVTSIIRVPTSMDETVNLAKMTHSFFTWSAVSVAAMAVVFSVPVSCVGSSRTSLTLVTRLLILT